MATRSPIPTAEPLALYAAVRARDPRFDGVIYVGVSTTGIYCRPICPVKTPGPDRCTFYRSAAEAERAGFRACLRCRPELAPGHRSTSVDALATLARAAVARIDQGFLNDHSVDALATELGVTARHLRRTLLEVVGVGPLELAQTRRLALAKQLLQDTALGLADIAFAAGFGSVRRFNATFREVFGKPPSQIRRGPIPADDLITLTLDYRPQLDFEALLNFFAARAFGTLESVENATYRREVHLEDLRGHLTVQRHPTREALQVGVSGSLAPRLMELVVRVRRQFDLDASPGAIHDHFANDPTLGPLVRARPGLRVPGAFDPFESSVRAILGQQVSVKAATTLATRLLARFGPPTPAGLAAHPPETLRTIGLTQRRAETLSTFARAVADGQVDLGDSDPERTIARLEALPGIGPWTAHYMAMRALAWPDAFPASDLGVLKALGVTTGKAAESRATPWRPFRAYAVLHLWHAPTI